jgi:hypothetical protein
VRRFQAEGGKALRGPVDRGGEPCRSGSDPSGLKVTTVLTTMWAAFGGKRRPHADQEVQRFRLFKPFMRKQRYRAAHTYTD